MLYLMGGDRMNFKEGFIICNASMKEKIVKQVIGFKDYIFLTYEEVKNKLTFQIKKRAVYAIMKHYGFSYGLAVEYIQAVQLIEDKAYLNPKLDSIVSVLHYLKQESLIEEDVLFKIRLRQYPITFVDPTPSKEYERLKALAASYTVIEEVFLQQGEYQPCLYEFSTIEEEALFVMNQISELYKKGIPLNHIYIAHADDSFRFILKRLSKSFSIPIQFEALKNISSFAITQDFLRKCYIEEDFHSILKQMDHTHPLYPVFVDLINSYELVKEKPMDCIAFFKAKFKSISYPNKIYLEAVQLVSEDLLFQESDYVFYVGFNLGSSPKIEQEQGFLNDADLNRLSCSTSTMKNMLAHERLKQFIKNTPNLTLTYRLYVNQDVYLPSLLIREMGLEVTRIEAIDYGYAPVEDELRLVGLYDLYLKYGQWHPDLENYGIGKAEYKTYQHQYQKISQELLDLHFEKKPLRLAYSNVKLYFACPFSYYADRILGLNEFKPQMAARLGTFAHAVLEDSYKESFSFEESVEFHKKENAFDAKDVFFFNQMQQVLKNMIHFNQSHEQESKLTTIEREVHVEVVKDSYTFEGYIDKLMYTIREDEIYAAIVDYKTGADIISLDNIEDGFHLQLPSYMYLLSKYEAFANKKIHIIGIFLQKVNIVLYDSKSDVELQMAKRFMLEGYSVANPSLLAMLDPTYEHSTYIKSLGMGRDGFLRYSKIFLESQQDEIIAMVENLLDTASKDIQSGIFPIAPKKIRGKNESCTFCKYKDLCFCDYADEIELEYKPFGKGGDGNGLD